MSDTNGVVAEMPTATASVVDAAANPLFDAKTTTDAISPDLLWAIGKAARENSVPVLALGSMGTRPISPEVVVLYIPTYDRDDLGRYIYHGLLTIQSDDQQFTFSPAGEYSDWWDHLDWFCREESFHAEAIARGYIKAS